MENELAITEINEMEKNNENHNVNKTHLVCVLYVYMYAFNIHEKEEIFENLKTYKE